MRSIFLISLPLAAATHYEDPAKGCGSDEQAIQVTGVSGDFCSPTCSGTTPCPSSASDAKPQCILSSSPGAYKCVLICTPGSNAACPVGASCQSIQRAGICTYPVAGDFEHLSMSVPAIISAEAVEVEHMKEMGGIDNGAGKEWSAERTNSSAVAAVKCTCSTPGRNPTAYRCKAPGHSYYSLSQCNRGCNSICRGYGLRGPGCTCSRHLDRQCSGISNCDGYPNCPALEEGGSLNTIV